MNNDGLKVARVRSAFDSLRRARATIARILTSKSIAAKFDMQPGPITAVSIALWRPMKKIAASALGITGWAFTNVLDWVDVDLKAEDDDEAAFAQLPPRRKDWTRGTPKPEVNHQLI